MENVEMLDGDANDIFSVDNGENVAGALPENKLSLENNIFSENESAEEDNAEYVEDDAEEYVEDDDEEYVEEDDEEYVEEDDEEYAEDDDEEYVEEDDEEYAEDDDEEYVEEDDDEYVEEDDDEYVEEDDKEFAEGDNDKFVEQDSSESDYKAQFEKQRKQINDLVLALNRTGFKGSAADIADTLQANSLDMSVEDYRKKRDMNERIYTSDLLSIKERYPNETAMHVSEFGEEFAKLRSSGVDAVKAYEVLNMDKVISQKVEAAINSDRKKRDSKRHLNTAGVTGTRVPNDVPASVYREYRKFFPEMTDKAIRAHYYGTLKD